MDVLAFAAGFALLMLACGDNEEEGIPTTPSGARTPTPGVSPSIVTPGGGPITADDLASLVLTANEVSEAFPGLAPVQRTFQGPVSNEEAVGRAIEPEERQADIGTYGRVAGYEASYAPQGGEEEIRLELELYESDEGASGALRKGLNDLPQLYGAGAQIEEFEVGSIGDEAEGITGVLNVPITGIFLRVDGVLAIVSVALSEEDVRDGVRLLAQKVAEKVEAFLDGQ